jgi:hypothetical protein
LLRDIERAFEEGLVDPGYITLKNVHSDLAMGKERVLARLAGNPHRRLVEDTIAEMKWWACFHETQAKSTNRLSPEPFLKTPASPTRRLSPKIGRNELGLPPWLRQTVKTLFAVRCKNLDRQDHFIAF